MPQTIVTQTVEVQALHTLPREEKEDLTEDEFVYFRRFLARLAERRGTYHGFITSGRARPARSVS